MKSAVCRYDHFTTEWYKSFAEIIGQPTDVSLDRPAGYRKYWEWSAILEALRTRGMLEPGRSGMSFAVGQEPLPSIMASHGVRVLATDLAAASVSSAWADTGQHSTDLEGLYKESIVDRATFDSLVSFMPADMNALPPVGEQFDFVWTSCAFEHLGTLGNGLDFVVNAMDFLKPGGIAVHTTEFNITSNEATIVEGWNCLYRKRDLEELDARLRFKQCALEPIDFDIGHHPYDLMFDQEPYFNPGRVHIKLQIGNFICTSVLLIARKA